jgi:hypothetical protein
LHAELAAANAKVISMTCKLHTPLLGRRKRIQRRLSVKKLSGSAICFTKKLAGLCHDMEKSVATLNRQCFEFPTTNATVGTMLDFFWTEVQALPTTFDESNQNITCFVVACILRMLGGGVWASARASKIGYIL